MRHFAQIASTIDKAWIAIGLDFHRYSQNHPDKAKNLAVWLITVGVTIGYGCLYYIFAALLMSWENALGWSKSDLTLGLTGAILVAAFVSPYAGRAIDSGQGRWLLSGGLLLGGLAVAALFFVNSQMMFIGIWLVIGVAQGFCLYDPCFALVTRTLHEDAAKAIRRITLTAGFASTIAFPSATFLASQFSWQIAVIAFAGVIIFIGAPAMYIAGTLLECCPRDSASMQKAENKANLKQIKQQKVYWLLFFSFPFIALATGMVLTHIMPILIEQNLKQSEAVFLVALIGPMQVCGRFFITVVMARFGTLATTIMSFSGIAISFFILLFWGNNTLFVAIFACLLGMAYGLVNIVKPLLTAELLGRKAFGAVSGALALPVLVCHAFAPQLGSELWKINRSYDVPLLVAIATAVFAILCMVALIRLRKSNTTS